MPSCQLYAALWPSHLKQLVDNGKFPLGKWSITMTDILQPCKCDLSDLHWSAVVCRLLPWIRKMLWTGREQSLPMQVIVGILKSSSGNLILLSLHSTKIFRGVPNVYYNPSYATVQDPQCSINYQEINLTKWHFGTMYHSFVTYVHRFYILMPIWLSTTAKHSGIRFASHSVLCTFAWQVPWFWMCFR